MASTLDQPIEEAEELIEAILPLYELPDELNVSRDQFIADVVDAVRVEWKTLPAENAAKTEQQLVARLRHLTELDEVASLVKTADVLTEYERPFQSVRILTDLRPVFPERAGQPPIGMGIVHSLKISYDTADHGSEEVFIALDSRDLGKLRAAVERAEGKATLLKRQLFDAGLRFLESE